MICITSSPELAEVKLPEDTRRYLQRYNPLDPKKSTVKFRFPIRDAEIMFNPQSWWRKSTICDGEIQTLDGLILFDQFSFFKSFFMIVNPVLILHS